MSKENSSDHSSLTHRGPDNERAVESGASLTDNFFNVKGSQAGVIRFLRYDEGHPGTMHSALESSSRSAGP